MTSEKSNLDIMPITLDMCVSESEKLDALTKLKLDYALDCLRRVEIKGLK